MSDVRIPQDCWDDDSEGADEARILDQREEEAQQSSELLAAVSHKHITDDRADVLARQAENARATLAAPGVAAATHGYLRRRIS